MSQAISLKELERKAWRSTFQDGIWDIYLGLLLMAMAASAFMTDSGIPENAIMPIFIGLEIIAIVALWAGKKFITLPRVGRVKFGQKRKSRLHWINLLLALSVMVGILLWVVTPVLINNGTSGFTLNTLAPAVWALNCIILFSLGAFLLDFSRLYLIGVLYAVTIPVDSLLRQLTNVDLSFLAFGLPGLAIVIIGLVVLTRFLRDYPAIRIEEKAHDSQ